MTRPVIDVKMKWKRAWVWPWALRLYRRWRNWRVLDWAWRLMVIEVWAGDWVSRQRLHFTPHQVYWVGGGVERRRR